MLKKIAWIIFTSLAIIIGFYPSLYLFLERSFGLLSTKSSTLLSNFSWNIFFYTHIIFAAIALLIGWIQFDKNRRKSSPKFHRVTGKMYVTAVLISGVASLYIGCFATGGIISSIGFISLGAIWLGTTLSAFVHAKNKQFELHKKLMVYSYAACFAGVTLRIWLPLLTFLIGDFIPAYQLVAWLCWVPNLLFAYIINSTKVFNKLSQAQKIPL